MAAEHCIVCFVLFVSKIKVFWPQLCVCVIIQSVMVKIHGVLLSLHGE